MYDHSIIVPKRRPRFGRVDEIDLDVNTLLLDPERRDLEEAGWVDTCHCSTKRRTSFGPGVTAADMIGSRQQCPSTA